MISKIKIGSFTTKNNIFLAPMAGITDMPFRCLCAQMGAGLTCTEMVSSRGIHYRDKKTEALTITHPAEAPCAVQIFGSEPEIMAEAAAFFNSREDIAVIDINMGCPTPKIVKNGDGCALMQDEKLAARIIAAVAGASRKPVTVKFRKGFERCSAVEFAQMAQASGAKALTIHGRTREQFYAGKADWEIISRVKQAVDIPVIGNGDVFTPQQAQEMIERTGCDGVMIGRGAQGNPWIFKRTTHYLKTGKLLPFPSNDEKYQMIKVHLQKGIELKGEEMAVKEMRKHIAWYLRGMPGAAKVRSEIMTLTSAREVKARLEAFFGRNSDTP